MELNNVIFPIMYFIFSVISFVLITFNRRRGIELKRFLHMFPSIFHQYSISIIFIKSSSGQFLVFLNKLDSFLKPFPSIELINSLLDLL